MGLHARLGTMKRWVRHKMIVDARYRGAGRQITKKSGQAVTTK